jgi:hypothetical protein
VRNDESAATCSCEPDLDEVLFARQCDYCATEFGSAHCSHDLYQDSCPECDVVAVPQLIDGDVVDFRLNV